MSILNTHTQWVPNILMAEMIGVLQSKLLATKLGVVNPIGGFSNQKDGEEIKVPERGTVTARTKTAGQSYAFDSPSGTLNSFGVLGIRHTSFWLENNIFQLASMGLNPIQNGYVQDALTVLAKEIDELFFGLYSSATYSDSGSSLTDAVVLRLKNALTTKDVGYENRVMVVSPDIYDNDLINPSINPYYSGKDTAAGTLTNDSIVEGAIGRVRGFSVFESNHIVSTGASPAVDHCVAFQKGALGIQFGLLRNDLGPNVQSYQMNYEGLPLRMRIWQDPLTDMVAHSIDCLFAVGILDQRKLVAVDVDNQ